MAYCDQCGRENRRGANFCAYCGQAMPPIEEEAPAGQELPGSPVSPGAPTRPVGSHPRGQALPSAATRPVALRLFPPEPGGIPRAGAPAAEAPAAETPAARGAGMPQAHPHPSPDLAKATAPIQSQKLSRFGEEGLQPGSLLAGRFRILRSLEEGQLEAHDLLRCWSCATMQEDPEPRFCELCGVELSQFPIVRLAPVSGPGPMEIDGEMETLRAGDGRTYWVTRAAPHAQGIPAVRRLRAAAGFQTDTGQVREINEDSLLVLQLDALAARPENSPALCFLAVADGIGGHAAGEVASRTAIHSLAASVMQSIFAPQLGARPVSLSCADLAGRLEQAVLAANAAILELRRTGGAAANGDMGCTLTAVLVSDSSAVAVNVGDSRTYLLRDGRLSQVTRDHSMVARLVEQGLVTAMEAGIHEQKGIIYRSLGDQPELEVDSYPMQLQAGDRLLLCSDGLWEMVGDDLIEEVLLDRADPQPACRRLAELANLSGGEDNISLIVANLY